MQRITDYLRADHERLHALLERAASSTQLELAAFEQFRAGLLRHIAIEEKLLLTAARRERAGEPLSRAHALRIEHGALASLLVPTPDHALCRELAALITRHDAVEEGEGGIYAECEALFSDELSRSLLERARAFPEVPVAPHFDGVGSVRLAEVALASARRMAPPRAAQRGRGERELEALRAQHASFRKLLDVLQAQLALFHCGYAPDYELMRDIFDYLTSYPDRFHHPKEDLAFHRLAERDPSATASVELLAQQHEVLAYSGTLFLQNLDAALGGTILRRAAIEEPAAEYIAFYRAHMKLEEQELFPRVRQQLQDGDWAAIDAVSDASPDPLFGARVAGRYRALRRQIAAAAECGCVTEQLS